MYLIHVSPRVPWCIYLCFDDRKQTRLVCTLTISVQVLVDQVVIIINDEYVY